MPDLTPIIRHPARFVPLAAVATEGVDGTALPVSSSNPVPTSDAPYSAARALVEDTSVAPGKALLVDCSQGGVLNLELADTTQLPLTFAPGVTLLPFSVRQRLSLGSTATASAWVLD